MSDIDFAGRRVSVERVDDLHAPGASRAYLATVEVLEYVDSGFAGEGRVISDFPAATKEFAVVTVSEDLADEVRGEIPDVDGTPVMVVGTHFGKNFYQSDGRTVPVDLLEKLRERDMVLVRDVDGGWASWDGRPEWSESFIDFSEAEAVDMGAEIAERRDGEGSA